MTVMHFMLTDPWKGGGVAQHAWLVRRETKREQNMAQSLCGSWYGKEWVKCVRYAEEL